MSEQIALFFFFPPHFRSQIWHPFSRLFPAAKAANCKIARFSIMFPFATVLFKSDRFLTPSVYFNIKKRASPTSILSDTSSEFPHCSSWCAEIDFRITVNRAEQHCQWNTMPDTREEHGDYRFLPSGAVKVIYFDWQLCFFFGCFSGSERLSLLFLLSWKQGQIRLCTLYTLDILDVKLMWSEMMFRIKLGWWMNSSDLTREVLP